jgi:hypothetical protein
MNDSEVEAVVRDALTRHQTDAPAGHGLVDKAIGAGVRRRWRRRRAVGLLAVAVVAVAAIAVAVPRALHTSHHRPPAKPPVTGVVTTVRMLPPPFGAKIVGRSVDAQGEHITFTSGPSTWTLSVGFSVFPGGTDVGTLPSGRKAAIYPPIFLPGSGIKLREGFHDPVRVPFTFLHVPGGYRLTGAAIDTTSTVRAGELTYTGPGGSYLTAYWGTLMSRCDEPTGPVQIGDQTGQHCEEGDLLADYHGHPLMIAPYQVPDGDAVLAGLRWTG